LLGNVISLFPEDHPTVIFGDSSKMNSGELERIGVKITDETLDSYFEEVSLPTITYGGVGVDGDEAAALNSHPKMRILEDIRVPDIELEVEKCLSKIRYNEQKANSNKNNAMLQGNTNSNLPHICSSSSGTSSTLTSENTLRFSSRGVASLPFNKQVILPDVMESREEKSWS